MILCVPVHGQVWRSCIWQEEWSRNWERVSVCVKHVLQKYHGFPPLLQCSAMIFLAHLCWVGLGNHHSGRNCRNENSLTTSFFLRAGGTTQNEKLQEHVQQQETHKPGFWDLSRILQCTVFIFQSIVLTTGPGWDELWGWFSWIWKPFPGPDASREHSTTFAHSARWWWRESSKDN